MTDFNALPAQDGPSVPSETEAVSSAGAFGIRRSLYGSEAFEVVKIAKETARTHSVITRSWRGGWGERAWLTRSAFVGTRTATEEAADAICAAGNAAWNTASTAVAAAEIVLSGARADRIAAADAAIAKATTASAVGTSASE